MVEVRSYTIQSHGAGVARMHLHDWLTLILLVFIIGILNIIDPFYRFVGKDMMTDLKYPLQPNTVPVWAVPVSLSFSIHLFYTFIHSNSC